MVLSHDNQKLVERMEAIHFNNQGSETYGGPPLVKKRKKNEPVTIGSMNFAVR